MSHSGSQHPSRPPAKEGRADEGLGEEPSGTPTESSVDVSAVDLERLIRDHHASAYRYAYRLSGSEADAEDLTQQAFLIAQQRLDQLREPGRAGGWLLSIVRTCFLKSLRRERPVAESSSPVTLDEVADDSTDEPFDRERLRLALAELPEEQRVVLLMFYFEDVSYKEIAEQLGVAIGTVMSRLSRAKQRLRTILVAKERSEALYSRETRGPGAEG